MKLVIGGQMDKLLIAKTIDGLALSEFTYETMSDIEAAVAVKSGQADYYIGACATGAGGALGLAIGIIGGEYCVSISLPGKQLSKGEIAANLKDGKKAFGMVNQDIEVLVPILIECIKENN